MPLCSKSCKPILPFSRQISTDHSNHSSLIKSKGRASGSSEPSVAIADGHSFASQIPGSLNPINPTSALSTSPQAKFPKIPVNAADAIPGISALDERVRQGAARGGLKKV